jgi:hypothetical protein
LTNALVNIQIGEIRKIRVIRGSNSSFQNLFFTMLHPFRTLFFLLVFFSFFTLSCGNDADKKNIPDISGIEADVKIIRFEQALFGIDTTQTEVGLQNLENQYPKIAKTFFQDIIAAKKPNEAPPQYFPMVKQFLTDSFVRQTSDTCQKVFKNFDTYKKELNQAVRFYKYYFPKFPEPTFFTFVSQYNYDVFPVSLDTIGIGLDFYLGTQHTDYQYIENLRYEYIRRTLTPEHLVSKTMRIVVQNAANAALGGGNTEGGNRLLDMMINNGKQLYILDQLMPYAPDSVKFGYSGVQTQWCKENEAGMWASFLKENVIYETNFKKIAKLVTPSPNSPGMPQEAPGETGNYVGWQIVKQFMKRNPTTSMAQLLAITDAQQILDRAKYKPAR